jgi:hypothetical protein
MYGENTEKQGVSSVVTRGQFLISPPGANFDPQRKTLSSWGEVP